VGGDVRQLLQTLSPSDPAVVLIVGPGTVAAIAAVVALWIRRRRRRS
jgi:hypothetical protein